MGSSCISREVSVNQIDFDWNNIQDAQRCGNYVPQNVIDKLSYAVDMLKSKGTKEEMTKQANDYANTVGMDQLNRNLLITLKTGTKEEFIKAAFTDPTDSKKQLSYAEMRSLYG